MSPVPNGVSLTWMLVAGNTSPSYKTTSTAGWPYTAVVDVFGALLVHTLRGTGNMIPALTGLKPPSTVVVGVTSPSYKESVTIGWLSTACVDAVTTLPLGTFSTTDIVPPVPTDLKPPSTVVVSDTYPS